MPQSIDWPRMGPSQPRRRRFVLILVVLAVIFFFGARAALSYYVDLLWFRSLGYGDVFWKTLNLRWEVFTVFAAATFVILYGSFLALKRAHLSDLPDDISGVKFTGAIAVQADGAESVARLNSKRENDVCISPI